MSIGVIGAGKWGSALHFALSRKQRCLITSRTKRDIADFTDLERVLSCEYIVIAIPAQQIREWLKQNFVYKGQKILVASKGIETKTGAFLNEIYADFVPDDKIAFLSGPSFAAEVIRSLPTALVVNSVNLQLAQQFASFFPDFIKTYVSDDVIGAEIAGAYKNVIAIAAGVCAGLELGNNALASLIARGLVEMDRFAKRHGAKDETFLGLSGAGDLFLTASSTMSRNFRVGLGLAACKTQEEILQELGEVAEGIGTAYALHHIAQKEELYLPIAKEVYLMLEGKAPLESLKSLLAKG